MIPQATLLYGALNTLLFVALSANVTRVRGQANAWIGDSMPPQLVRANRAHGNFSESVALSLGLLLALELGGASSMTTHVFGGTYLVLRLLHATGTLLKNPISVVGAMGTLVLLAAQAVAALMLHFR